jgi:hypothetical protein
MHLWKRATFRATGMSKFWISENDTLEDIVVGVELGDFPFFLKRNTAFSPLFGVQSMLRLRSECHLGARRHTDHCS